MIDYLKVSMTFEEVAEFKRYVSCGANFADRISLALAFRLVLQRINFGEDHHILFEISHLEQGVDTSTKPAEQFKHSPLFPLWHKHFSTSRHMLRNIGERWNVARGPGNRDLEAMIAGVVAEHRHDSRMAANLLTHHFVLGALQERSDAQRMTGDWIIFAKHEDRNYYLDLATHEEGEPGDRADQLFEKLKQGSSLEFPFLFKRE